MYTPLRTKLSSPGGTVLRILPLLLLPLVAYAADAPASPSGVPDAYSSILQRGVFGGDSGPSTAPQAASASTPFRLIGTLQSGGFSGAVLDDGAGVQTFYRINERLPDGSQIVKVMPNRVILKRPDGSVSELVVADDAPSPNPGPGVIAPQATAPAADASLSNSGQQPGPRPPRRRRYSSDE